ncbi:RNA-directed DNA polymerase [Stenotrophomonas sp. YAU14A_MKIMI4_1]|uniref:RNA-directed DNA polymerase n=1 Tax=Stenotrophomonas sp. YAU14A_MKIMI4_1 TaxID=2072408 RepID=UPI000D54121E|nr:RNA-directed DNA polymerase [Stenotrophomonas sp. YAU14A_MKIMI4_1]AWH28960.1 hypothetical protein C1931_08535 [Stenotrophomonas sp. YAU14A_MKIMI4_1]
MEQNDEGRTIDLLAFPIDVDSVLQHLHRDMRDDWFEDALQHRDLFSNKSSLREVLSEVLLGGNGRYVPSQSNVCDIPKKGLGVRYALETDFYDRFIYQAICSFLIPYYDPLLSHRVLGHRYDKRKRTDKDLFKGRIELWKTFEGVTKTALRNGQALFSTDLINYFENISIDSIRSAFEGMLPRVKASGPEKVLIRNAINTLCELMVRWCFNERHGLPQNRDASSFIANVVLDSVDQSMVRKGFDYYRYVDDIRIICNTPRGARRAATILIGELRSVGMNINSSKTKIITSDSSQDDIDEFFPGGDDRSIAIDNMWRSKSRRLIIRSVKYVFQMLSDCIESKQTQSRQFRFAVNRLIRLVESGIFDVQGDMSSQLKSLLIDSLEEHAASTDQYCRLLISLSLTGEELSRVEHYLCDNELAIHSWQNFHLWMIFARVGRNSPVLVKLAEERINEDILRSEVPAIFIYLRCVGQVGLLQGCVNRFRSTWPYYHQRSYLLSISELDRDVIKPLVPELGPKLRGTVGRAKSHFINNVPLLERERTSILRLYEELSPYD